MKHSACGYCCERSNKPHSPGGFPFPFCFTNVSHSPNFVWFTLDDCSRHLGNSIGPWGMQGKPVFKWNEGIYCMYVSRKPNGREDMERLEVKAPGNKEY